MLKVFRWGVLLLACAAGGAYAGLIGAIAVGALCLGLAKIPSVRRVPVPAQLMLLPVLAALLVVVLAASRPVVSPVTAVEISGAPAPAVAPEPSYTQRVLTAAMECNGLSGSTPMACFSGASPERCKAAAVAFVADRSANQRAYLMCLQSCSGGAGLAGVAIDCRIR